MSLRLVSLSNTITMLSMQLAFFSLLIAHSGKLFPAAALIVICIILDNIDGPIARKLNQSSDFGKEFDSLSDMTAFGIAPAYLIYTYGLDPFFSLTLLSCVGLRLAKYNTLKSGGNFIGLPSPAPAGFIASAVLSQVQIPTQIFSIIIIILSLFMISSIVYPKIPVEKKYRKKLISWGVGGGLLLLVFGLLGFFIIFSFYIMITPFLMFKRKTTISV